jgi:serine phosphatase RsbU (regulator of sigma subunit)/anti-sigma regulatory factor (Ser/Thr protein kinase)
MSALPSLPDELLLAWRQAMGVEVQVSVAEPEAAVRAALVLEGQTQGWLSLPHAPPDLSPAQAQHVLRLYAQVLGAWLGEHHVSTGLVEEVLVAWNQLTFLYEVLKINAFNLPIGEVMEKISALTRDVFHCQNAFIAFRDQARLTYRSPEPLEAERVERYFALVAQQKVLVLNDRTPTFLGARVPITTSGEAIVGLIGSEEGEFKARDRQLAESLAEQIGSVLDNLALQQALAANLRLQHEIEIAAQIQMNLLPARLPQPPGFELAGLIVPASQVGGDFYDVVELNDGALAVLTGDVAGKGIPAAMLTTLIRTELRGQALAGLSPGEVIARANVALEPDLNRLATFATALVARLDPAQGGLTFASAGHTASFYWRAATASAEELLSTALPLGIFPESNRAERALNMSPGDVLVLYSDGVTEALNETGTIFGWNGLKDVLSLVHTAPAEVMVQAVLQAVDAHRRRQPVNDDLTLLVLKRCGPAAARRARAFVIASETGAIKLIGPQLEAALLGEAPETWQHEFELAVIEHVTNIIRHACAGRSDGRVHGLFSLWPDRLTLETLDDGGPFDIARLPAKMPNYTDWKDLPEGGYGLPLIRAVMDEIHYLRRPDQRNYWRMERRLTASPVRAL